MERTGNFAIYLGFIGAVLVFAATVFVVAHYAPDQYARWNNGTEGSVAALK